MDFEWVVVDDGSTDGTHDLIERFASENKIKIAYQYKENGGKHTAINVAAKHAKGVWFFIVDSDDYITDDAIEWIIANGADVLNDNRFAGIVGERKSMTNNRKIYSNFSSHIDINSVDFKYQNYGYGDRAEVYKTDVIREFPFPEFEGERFCSEELVWNRIARQYMLRYFDRTIYICEYLDDGLSNNVTINKLKSPNLSMITAEELIKYWEIPFKEQIKRYAWFWTCSIISGYSIFKSFGRIGFKGFLFFPLGILNYFRLRKYIK